MRLRDGKVIGNLNPNAKEYVPTNVIAHSTTYVPTFSGVRIPSPSSAFKPWVSKSQKENSVNSHGK